MLEKSSVWNFCALTQTSFGGETSGSVAKSRRFSQTKNFFSASLSLVSQKPGYEVTAGTIYVPIYQVRRQNRGSLQAQKRTALTADAKF